MVSRSARVAASIALLAACADLSNLSGGTSDAATDAGARGPDDADAKSPSDGASDAPGDAAFACDAVAASVIFCATFDPGTSVTDYGAVEPADASVTVDPTEGATAPGSLLSRMAPRDAATQARARFKRALTNAPHLRASFSLRVAPLSEGESVFRLELGTYQLALYAARVAGGYTSLIAEYDTGTDASFKSQSMAAVSSYGAWERYVFDFYESENMGTSSHVDVSHAGETVRLDLTAHTHPSAQVLLTMGIQQAFTVVAEERVGFDDVLVEALPR
jgi:hypothetical protein